MEKRHIEKIVSELEIKPWQVEATAALLGDGATVPFIARYRKEVTGSLDEIAITMIRDRLAQLAELDKRRSAILKSLKEQEKLTEELKEKIDAAETLAVLEDLYLPFRPKRRTRATIAKEKGLEPLARYLVEQDGQDPRTEAEAFVNQEKGVGNVEEALSGARDILAEWINEDREARARMRTFFQERAAFKCKVISGKEEEGINYKDYFAWQEPVSRAPSHRILAMRRGEKEGMLTLSIMPEEEAAIGILESLFVKGESACSEQVKMAAHDSYKRLLSHSMETEIRVDTKKRADEEAIKIFTTNLRQLLLSSPLGQKTTMAIDPGFRTGCKVVCLDPQGKLVHHDTIYPLLNDRRRSEASQKIVELCDRFVVEAIAVGNGTGGRETERFIREIPLADKPHIVMVDESGASVYSASGVAREEFPDQDVTVRGAVSIGRRLMDPLAELVKIDPKSIGVGQYQHDVDQRKLKSSLDDVVMSCVNGVGVEVNTASRQLLGYVSGLGPQLAANIVTYREENGPFTSRAGLMKVPRLGQKAFEQAAGFLRIREGKNPLDASAVHPESYPIVEAMAKDLHCSVEDLLIDGDLRGKIELERYVNEQVGLPTLGDILEELARPGRDPREQFESVQFEDGIETLEDLEPGMKLPGVVTNITAFGVFVDIGVHQDGLVHISQLADHFVKDANEVAKVHQRVEVTVLDVDLERRRISLSMKEHSVKQKEKVKRAPKVKREGKGKSKKKGKVLFNNPFSNLRKE